MDGCLNGHNAALKPKEHGSNLPKRQNCVYPTSVVRKDLSNNVRVALGTVKRQLYLLSSEALEEYNMSIANEDPFIACNETDSNVFWHQRLGHPSHNVLNELSFVHNKCIESVCDSIEEDEDVESSNDKIVGSNALPSEQIQQIEDNLTGSSNPVVAETDVQIDNDVSQVLVPQTKATSSRVSSRARKPLSWLKNYVTCTVSHPTTPQAFPFVKPKGFSQQYMDFLGNITHVKEPNNYEEAQVFAEWQEAMHKEICALEENNT
ncbi:Integrase core domain containing protein [Senna tora]|uniref:Integrase core domain containing protein n=1 Tax=Senna tora TaxID=362788 RepID=A0A834WN11_9FABA|nr:Integrase core domain containing protein [Senna tora]